MILAYDEAHKRKSLTKTGETTMNKVIISGRLNQEEINAKGKENKRAEKELQEKLNAQGLATPDESIPNTKSKLESVEEEIEERSRIACEHAKVLKVNLPVLLKRLSQIPDPRNPKKIKFKLTVLTLYGILCFVYNMASRREANRKMTAPIIMENLKLLFPELDDIPHNDTLKRLLAQIDVNQIEDAHVQMIKEWMRKKKFRRYLINGHYPIAIDGTQKFRRNYQWSEECLERKINGKKGDEPRKQYYVYVLEASLAFQNGLTIPIMSEILSYKEGDTDTKKQDCEIKAFKRLAKRLKEKFLKHRITLLLDGLYPNGPIMDICRNNHWGFMIVFKDDNLPSVWEEYEGLLKLSSENKYKMNWGSRKQSFTWVNEIDYYFDKGKKVVVHVVICVEEWEELDKASGQILSKTSKHAWISSTALNKKNLHERCNLAARHRWNIENEILVEKHNGYSYEHCFSYDWNAMKGYHYLMRLGHALNVMALYSERLKKDVREKTMKGLVAFVRETLMFSLLDVSFVETYITARYQIRLI